MAEIGAFAGFPEEGLGFLRELSVRNERAFFEENRSKYEACVQMPAKALVVDLGAALRAELVPGINADPRVGRSMFLINRDLRFSKDKTPYNPWVDFVFWEGDDPRRSPLFFLRLSGEAVIAGAGVMGLLDDRLERYRAAVDNADSGETLMALLESLKRDIPEIELSGPRWSRVPAGFPPGYPRAELLRHDSLTASLTMPLPAELHDERFIGWLIEKYRPVAPLLRWLVKGVGP
jgi:uncharacterized protein (TIGR02453 family)